MFNTGIKSNKSTEV